MFLVSVSFFNPRFFVFVSSCSLNSPHGKMPLSSDEWQSLPYQMVLNHYELQDGRPTGGELQLDLRLASIGQHNQLPLSHNLHSIFNLRHYITYGGYLLDNNLIKPPWVSVQQTGDGNDFCDRCTLCRTKKKGALAWCNDSHFQSDQHTTKVVKWFSNFELQCHRDVACAASASMPSSCATANNGASVLHVPPPPPPPPHVSYDVSQDVETSAAARTDPGAWNPAWGDSWGKEWRSPPPPQSGGELSMIGRLSAQAPVLLRAAVPSVCQSGWTGFGQD